MLALPKKYLIALFLLFILSVTIRFVNIGRPLSKHHEFNTAMILNVCNSWDKAGGPHKYNFTPVTYFGNEGDKYYGQHSMIANAKLYYASMGPMQFLLPYYCLRLVGADFNVVNLHLFGCIMHLVLTLLLMLVLKIIFRNIALQDRVIFLAVSLFIFLPNFLWFFSNSISHESIVLILILLFFIIANVKRTFVTTLLIAFVSLFGVLTDWYMLFFVSSYFVIELWYRRKLNSEISFLNIFSAFMGSLGALIFIYYFYSATFGDAHFLKMFAEKFESRTANSSLHDWSFIDYVSKIATNFFSGYLPIILLCFTLLYIVKGKVTINDIARKWLLVFALPAILYNVMLLEFSTRHDYSNLKYGIPLLFFVVVLFESSLIHLKRVALASMFWVVVGLQIGLYLIINGAYKIKPWAKYQYEEKLGLFIKRNTKPNEHIFLVGNVNNYPAIMHYANRNVWLFLTEDELKTHIQKHRIKNNIYIKQSAQNTFEAVALNVF